MQTSQIEWTLIHGEQSQRGGFSGRFPPHPNRTVCQSLSALAPGCDNLLLPSGQGRSVYSVPNKKGEKGFPGSRGRVCRKLGKPRFSQAA